VARKTRQKFFRKKYNGFTMENARQLQGKALQRRGKNPSAQEQWKTMDKTMRMACSRIFGPAMS
jgi:hypothetical protein